MPVKPIKLDFIDGLRGIAILGVIMVHTSELVLRPDSRWMHKIALEATHGVQLFYLVSAFTLLLSYHTRKKDSDSLVFDFYLRRFFRIAPLFYLSMLVYLFLDGTGPRYFAPNGINWIHILTTATFTNGWYPTTITSIIPGGWSVAIEMNFYLLLPIFYKYVTTLHRSLWFTLLALLLHLLFRQVMTSILSPLFPENHLYLIFFFLNTLCLPAQMSIFGLGFIFFYLFSFTQNQPIETRSQHRNPNSLIFFMIFFYIIAALLTTEFQLRAYTLVPRHFVYGIAFLVFAYALLLFPSPLFVNFITKKMGRISYSMYLIHPLLLKMFKKIVVANFALSMNRDLLFLIAYISLVLATYLIAAITHDYIEKPGIALGQKIILIKKKFSVHISSRKT